MTMNGFSIGVGLVADGHLLLLHGFQQRALHLGRGAVDLVGQQQIGEDRSLAGVKVGGLGIEDHGAGQVGGEQVGGELDALEGQVGDPGQGLDGQGLGQPRHAFEQDMPRGQQGDHHPLQQFLLADDDLGHFGHGLLEQQAFFLYFLVDECEVVAHWPSV